MIFSIVLASLNEFAVDAYLRAVRISRILRFLCNVLRVSALWPYINLLTCFSHFLYGIPPMFLPIHILPETTALLEITRLDSRRYLLMFLLVNLCRARDYHS